MNSTKYCEESAAISTKRNRINVHVPVTNIETCIRVTLRQRVVTIVSILLVVSDILRTGVTTTPSDYYPPVGPGIAMYWGPYEYHVAHLRADDNSNSTHSSIKASCDGAPIASLEVWLYKKDTLSIAPRAVAKYLNVSSYPACIVYREPCKALTLDPGVVYRVLDDLATTIQQTFFTIHRTPVLLATKSNWVDRLHHILFVMFTNNPDIRLHAVFHTNQTKSIPIPFLGTDAVKWMCEHPLHPNGKRTIPIWDHIHIRIEDLSRRYPEAELDFTMFTSSLIEQTNDASKYICGVSYQTDTIEITTLVRGRYCDANRKCRTAFVDDYRYERSWIISDDDRWVLALWFLRGSGQVYIWIRVSLLVSACFVTTKSEPGYMNGRFFARLKKTWAILSRIPGHTVVYGSWYPLTVYALAQFFDGSLVQMVGEFAWTSVGGLYSFNLIQYSVMSSIQMRNIWMIALVSKAILTIFTVCTNGRYVNITPLRSGLLSFRAGWIGFISWLTTFALMRALHFRNTDIVSVQELPRHIPVELVRNTRVLRNFVDYGPIFDLKCMLLSTIIAVGAGWFVKSVVRFFSDHRTAVFACRTHYFPLSAGQIWSWSVLDTVWPMELRTHTRTSSNVVNILQSSPPSQEQKPLDTSVRRCSVCTFRTSCIHWRSTYGCPIHEPIFNVANRTKAIWSMVRLTNVAAMTDPIVFFRLYVVGVPLYVYRVPCDGVDESALLVLPVPPKNTAQTTHTTGNMDREPKYVTTIDSRDVPWHVLINCG